MGNLSNVLNTTLIYIYKELPGGIEPETNAFLIFKLPTEPCQHARECACKLIFIIPPFLLTIITSLSQLPFLKFSSDFRHYLANDNMLHEKKSTRNMNFCNFFEFPIFKKIAPHDSCT